MSTPAENPANAPLSGSDVVRQFFSASHYIHHLGMQLVSMQPGTATLVLPFGPPIITTGTAVHGGAIASLIDTAAAVAAWSGTTVHANTRGATVSLTVSYLAAANQEDLRATARVIRRGSNLVFLDVEVQGASGHAVAKGLVTYKLG